MSNDEKEIKMNEETLQAEETQSTQDVETADSVIYSEYNEQFQAFAILAMLLLIIEACLLEVRNPLFKNIKLFKKK